MPEQRTITLEELQSLEERNPKIVQRSRIEGAVIRDFARRMHLTTYVDLGCWVGLLAQDALQYGDFKRAVLVDAVDTCIRKTFAKVDPSMDAEYYCMAIVADAETREFQIPVFDTSCAGFGRGGVTISVPREEVCSFLDKLKLDLADTYLKTDLEGLDLEIARRLSQTNRLPRVLHIEFSTPAEFEFLHSLLKERYTFPEPRKGHAFYSMALSEERGVLIGFDPDFAYS